MIETSRHLPFYTCADSNPIHGNVITSVAKSTTEKLQGIKR